MQTIYKNGDIITVSERENVDTVLTEDGIIKAVGNLNEIMELSDNAKIVDLEGNTMMPAFIDAHSHLSSYANSFLQVNLKDCTDFNDITDKITMFITENNIQKGKWVQANGYDHNQLNEKRHITATELNKWVPDNPIIINHASGHSAILNSSAMSLLGITSETPIPDGGNIDFENGYIEENALFKFIKEVPMPDINTLAEAYKKAQQGYASYGITKVQEGMMVKQMIPIYEYLLRNNLLFLDVTAFASMQDAKIVFDSFSESNGLFKVGGYKIFLDGSPQNRTAWMRTPYLNEDKYFGYPTMKYSEVVQAVETSLKTGRQILAHCNGDAAAGQYLDAIEDVSSKGNISLIRPVMIHAQFLGIDQLDEVKSLGVIPSFFTAHTYYWGDVHIENFGLKRASSISPAKSALEKGIVFTFHQDSPVIEPNMLETIYCAVNRITKNGITLGKNERISTLEAIKAVTINAAYQYFEEDKRGSIEYGKYADFVILDKNPLKISPTEICNIKVLKTIKKDKEIYSYI